MEQERQHGTVVRYIENRGFGFIRVPGRPGPDVFFHYKQICGNVEPDETLQGRTVEFDIEQGLKGVRATRIELL